MKANPTIKKFFIPAIIACTVLALIPQVTEKSAAAKSAADVFSYDAIDQYLEAQMKRLKIPGLSLAIVEGDQITHLRGFGRARPGGEAPSPQTPFFIGSTTKSFTALAMMQLVEAGKVNLDAPVQDYLPWFRVADPQASAQITVRHLLNQTSSLPLSPAWQVLSDFDDRPDAAERQVRALSTLELARPVGAAFEYSNLNYNILGLIIEAASGESYAAYIQNHIFDPLQMRHSYTSKAAARTDGLAVGHQTWFGIPVAVPDLPIPNGSLPSGQLISSAEDMGKYLIAHLNGGRYGESRILSPESIAELHRPAVEAGNAGVSMGQYGMGWYIEEQDQTVVISHTGMVPDFFTYMALLPEQNKAVVLLINGNHFTSGMTLAEVGAGAAALLAGNTPAPLQFGAFPWLLRLMPLVPLLQIAGVAAALRRLNLWRRDPHQRPSRKRMWGLHILPSLTLNLIPISAGLALWATKLRGFWMLFMPDLSWLALISGSFALAWTFLRTGLLLRLLRNPKE